MQITLQLFNIAILTRSIELINEIIGLCIIPLSDISPTKEAAYDENPQNVDWISIFRTLFPHFPSHFHQIYSFIGARFKTHFLITARDSLFLPPHRFAHIKLRNYLHNTCNCCWFAAFFISWDKHQKNSSPALLLVQCSIFEIFLFSLCFLFCCSLLLTWIQFGASSWAIMTL